MNPTVFEEEKKPFSQNERIRKLLDISDELEITYTGVVGIYNVTYRFMSLEKSFSGLEVVRAFISDLLRNKQEVKEQLTTMKIKGSEDIGNVIFAFCEKGILHKEENDTFDIYQNIFRTDDIEVYIKKERLGKNYYKFILNLFFITGFVIILFSYARILPSSFLFVGTVMASLAWVMNYYEKPLKNFFKKYFPR